MILQLHTVSTGYVDPKAEDVSEFGALLRENYGDLSVNAAKGIHTGNPN